MHDPFLTAMVFTEKHVVLGSFCGCKFIQKPIVHLYESSLDDFGRRDDGSTASVMITGVWVFSSIHAHSAPAFAN